MSDAFGNGQAPPDFKAALGDRSRFQFKRKEIDLGEVVTGVKLKVKTLTVAERDALPDLTDKEGNPDISIPKLAAIFAAVVEGGEIDGREFSGKLTAEDAEPFLRDWPTAGLDKVVEVFGELTGTGEEQKAAAGTFPGRE